VAPTRPGSFTTSGHDLAKRLGRHVPIDIITGTSVGAINAAFLAATMSDPASQAEQIASAWRSLRIEELIGLRAGDMLRAGRMLLGREPPLPPPGSFRYGGILETSGLERFVIRTIPWRGIERRLRGGHLHAISVSATHVGTGQHRRIPVERRAGAARVEPRSVRAPSRRADRTRHVLASAAIPMLVPRGEDRRRVLHRWRPAPEHADVSGDPARRRSTAAGVVASRRARAEVVAEGAYRGVPEAAVPRRKGAERAAARSHRVRLDAHAADQLDPRSRPRVVRRSVSKR